MTVLAPTMQAFFTDRLIGQLHASPQTIASYRDTFRVLLGYIQREIGRQPARLQLEDLDARRVGAFLGYLEPNAATPPQPETRGSPQSIHCSSSPHYATPNTPN